MYRQLWSLGTLVCVGELSRLIRSAALVESLHCRHLFSIITYRHWAPAWAVGRIKRVGGLTPLPLDNNHVFCGELSGVCFRVSLELALAFSATGCSAGPAHYRWGQSRLPPPSPSQLCQSSLYTYRLVAGLFYLDLARGCGWGGVLTDEANRYCS